LVNASRRNIGLSLIVRAARLKVCLGNACLLGEEYEVKTGYIALAREDGSSALQEQFKGELRTHM
jgi:hypothetical protein